VVSLGGFASESIIGGEGGRSTGCGPVQKVAHGQPLRSPLGSMIRAQAKEGRGSPDDENGRHAPCHKIKI